MPARKRAHVDPLPWIKDLPELFEQWAEDLGVEISELKVFGVDGKEKDPPNLENRATRSRLREGGALEVRRDLYAALSRLENVAKPTATGRMMMGVEEWAEIGRALADLNSDLFQNALRRAREHLEGAKALVAGAPDFEKKETPPEPRKPALRSIGKTRIDPTSATVSRAGDALPWEKPAK